jgi:hypothetical protein
MRSFSVTFTMHLEPSEEWKNPASPLTKEQISELIQDTFDHPDMGVRTEGVLVLEHIATLKPERERGEESTYARNWARTHKESRPSDYSDEFKHTWLRDGDLTRGSLTIPLYKCSACGEKQTRQGLPDGPCIRTVPWNLRHGWNATTMDSSRCRFCGDLYTGPSNLAPTGPCPQRANAEKPQTYTGIGEEPQTRKGFMKLDLGHLDPKVAASLPRYTRDDASFAIEGMPPSKITETMQALENLFVQEVASSWRIRLGLKSIGPDAIRILRNMIATLCREVQVQTNDAPARQIQHDELAGFRKQLGNMTEFRRQLLINFPNELQQAEAKNQPLLELAWELLLRNKT